MKLSARPSLFFESAPRGAAEDLNISRGMGDEVNGLGIFPRISFPSLQMATLH